jgi:hypothetical protein
MQLEGLFPLSQEIVCLRVGMHKDRDNFTYIEVMKEF